jgi:hypothetical protein
MSSALPKPAAAPAACHDERHVGRSSVHFSVDREHQEITLSLHYTTAIIAAFTVLVAIVLAYAAGRHSGTVSSAPYAAASTDELRESPPTPGALDVAPRLSAVGSLQPAQQTFAPVKLSENPGSPAPPTNGIDTNQTEARRRGVRFLGQSRSSLHGGKGPEGLGERPELVQRDYQRRLRAHPFTGVRGGRAKHHDAWRAICRKSEVQAVRAARLQMEAEFGFVGSRPLLGRSPV